MNVKADPVVARRFGQAQWDSTRNLYVLSGADAQLGSSPFEGIAIGPSSEIDSIYVVDGARFTTRQPLMVSVGQPYPGHVGGNAYWSPAKTSVFQVNGPAPRYEVLAFSDGWYAEGFRKRPRYTRTFSGSPANAQKQVFFVGGRNRISFTVYADTSANSDLTLLVTASAQAPTVLDRDAGPATLSSASSTVALVIPATGSSFAPNFRSFPIEPGGIPGGFDMLQFGLFANADDAPIGAINIMVIAED